MVHLKDTMKTFTENTIIEIHNKVTKDRLMAKGTRDAGTLFWITDRLYRDIIKIQDPVIIVSRVIKNIIITHPFWDGNKRTGFAVADTLLRTIGYKIRAKPSEVEKFTMDIDRLRMSSGEIYKWLKKHIVKIKGK